jgi:hypothetical protein
VTLLLGGGLVTVGDAVLLVFAAVEGEALGVGVEQLAKVKHPMQSISEDNIFERVNVYMFLS